MILVKSELPLTSCFYRNTISMFYFSAREQCGDRNLFLSQACLFGYSELNSQWKKKASAIGELERQVSAMKQTWLNKESQLREERDKALEAARCAARASDVMNRFEITFC